MTTNYVPASWAEPTWETTKHAIGLVGASPFVRDDPNNGEGRSFRLGTISWGTNGQKWIYVGPAGADLAGAATPNNGVAIAVNGTTFAASAGVGYTAYSPLKSGQYGWVAAADAA